MDCSVKNLVLRLLSQKGPTLAQNNVFQFIWKIDSPNFAEFFYDFLGKNVDMRFLGQMGPKWGF